MRYKFGRLPVAFFMACLTLTISVFAAGDAVFRGGVVAEIVSVVPGSGGIVMTGQGTGISTQLGKYTRVETIFLDPVTGSFTGTIVFTGANGDELYGDISGQFTSQTTASGSYEFTGGTGRFENVTGSADFDVSLTDASHFIGGFAGSLKL